MRNFLLICLIGFSNLLIAQDWALFRPDMKSFYMIPTYLGSGVNFNFGDSVQLNASGYNITFNKNKMYPFEGSGECEDEVTTSYLNGDIYYTTNSFFPFLDSIVLRNDTTFIYSADIPYEMYFLHNADIGDYWEILPESFNHTYIKCISIDTQNIFGIIDSVRTYIFDIWGPFTSTILEDYQIKLSKHFGLLSYIDFNYYPDHSETSTPPVFSLIGIEDSINSYGFTIPDFEDWFDYNVGDKLFWERNVWNDDFWNSYNYSTYRTDSIIDKLVYADSIVYYFNSESIDTSGYKSYTENLKIIFKRQDFEPLLQSAPEWISFANNSYGSNSGLESIDLWGTQNMLISFEPTGSVITRQFFTGEQFLIIDDCTIEMMMDAGWNFTINDRMGVVEYSYGSWNYQITFSLIGYNIDGEQYGSTELVEHKDQIQLNVFPNPAIDLIYTGITVTHPLQYSIYNLQSQLIKNGMLTENCISVSDITSGIYLLEIRDDENLYQGKFIKE